MTKTAPHEAYAGGHEEWFARNRFACRSEPEAV